MRVLSIDGGGIRGVIPAVILAEIESKVGKPIVEIFDLIVGTSTGGILAVGLAAPAGAFQKAPKFTASDMLNLYVERGREIFSRSYWRGLTSVGDALDERYSADPIESIMKKMLGETMLSDTIKNIVVTAYDIEVRKTYFFKTEKARSDPLRDHPLWHVARATSAAPTFFEPFRAESKSGEASTFRVLVDGGVFANNPAQIAFTEGVTALRGDERDLLLVSIGTGTANRKIAYEEAKNWGLIGWARPIISVMMHGSSDATDYQLETMASVFNANNAAFRFDYTRLDTILDIASDDIDVSTKSNIQALIREAVQIVEGKDFGNLIAKLK